MFPTPIEKTKPLTRRLYKVALPISIIIWLLPLLAVALTSIRTGADINSGNYWGMPTSFNLTENYTAIFNNSPIGYYILNSFKVTIPTVIGAIQALHWAFINLSLIYSYFLCLLRATLCLFRYLWFL